MLPPAKRAPGISKDPSFAVVDPHQDPLTLDLGKEKDVQLVCVVNGLANNYTFYDNWSRVRSVETRTDDTERGTQSTLKSMDQSSFQEFQDVEVSGGKTRHVMVKVLDLYEGQEVISVGPNRCEEGKKEVQIIQTDPVIMCNLTPAPQGGLAEVKIYVRTTSRWNPLTHWKI